MAVDADPMLSMWFDVSQAANTLHVSSAPLLNESPSAGERTLVTLMRWTAPQRISHQAALAPLRECEAPNKKPTPCDAYLPANAGQSML